VRRTIDRDDHRGLGSAIHAAHKSRPALREARRALVTHPFAALVFSTAGHSVVEQRERWTVDEGDVLLVPAAEPHRWLEAEGFECWELSLCVTCAAAGEARELLEPFERVRAGRAPVVRIPSERRLFLLSLFRELAEATELCQEDLPLVEQSLVNLILSEVRRTVRSNRDHCPPAGVVAEALRFIEQNCLRPLSLNDVAKAVGRSPAYVTTSLGRATGRSAVQWIVAGRMAEARRVLSHSDEMIDVVAERVGYADPTHFIRMFRREHGVTPAAWRASNRRH
jgi:AraC family transcriptional activator of pobA